jgi:colanic acid/amylovoran biosynthesis glycosyltransferase
VEDGVSGFLVPEHDRDALANRIERLLGDRELRLEFGHAGRKRVGRDYDIARLNDSLVECFRQLSGSSAGACG